MAQVADLVLKNAAAVNVTYKPVIALSGKQAKWVDRTQGVIALQPYARLDFSELNGVRRTKLQHVYPVLAADNVTIDYEVTKVEITSPTKLTLAARQESLARMRQFIDDAVTTLSVENGETPS